MLGTITLSLQDALQQSHGKSLLESVAMVRSHFERGIDYSVPLPRIKPDTKHFKYASLRMYGVSNAKACEAAGITIKTAEKYRCMICKEAEKRYGFDIDYLVVIRDIVDYEIAVFSGRPIPKRLTGEK